MQYNVNDDVPVRSGAMVSRLEYRLLERSVEVDSGCGIVRNNCMTQYGTLSGVACACSESGAWSRTFTTTSVTPACS
jgi:hypothetical protein